MTIRTKATLLLSSALLAASPAAATPPGFAEQGAGHAAMRQTEAAPRTERFHGGQHEFHPGLNGFFGGLATVGLAAE